MIKSRHQTIITGVYRTGSEYIAHLIGCHPEISVTMYRVNVLRFIADKYDPISDPENLEKALSDLNQRLRLRYNIAVDKADVRDLLGQSNKGGYGALYDAVMTSLYLTQGIVQWAEKNQLLWREIPKFLEMMPDGKAILVLRDPRSVLASFKKYTNAPSPAYIGAVFNCYDAMKYAYRYLGELDKDRFLTLRYESVINDPAGNMERVWSFLELSNLEVSLENDGWKDSYGKNWYANSSFHKNNSTRTFDKVKAIERWRDELTASEVFLVEKLCEDIMPEFGYQLSNPESDWPEAMRLFAHDDKMFKQFRRWLICGEGMEAFPTDPLNSSNWETPNL